MKSVKPGRDNNYLLCLSGLFFRKSIVTIMLREMAQAVYERRSGPFHGA
jgi:hypothetical protein